ncbi:pyruvate dehydrogenase e1 beta subunit, putative [Ichthyophthirius multifiliis]|uniref:Pyruvate dehydrogenase E1 component subunit beta n=1 Tax=Ichthyophthirius multifiliis TaxID=5932 RepID=G0QY29_ICHMU|nr:pyruvate dehydrogenase e1 beta subunit, putative [Ichthyophthirius multifiliis]EGR29873.1 pyruvate dehydrogenase e1 beta subunit, putative [Ichthyophthirius multifiliis]|eukprot:XP_004031109.1 pyruvate dehydrogenase e1 beta subunit, putative [Ichthyophthirius multifiliis]
MKAFLCSKQLLKNKQLIFKIQNTYHPKIQFTHGKQPMKTISIRESLNLALEEELKRDSKCFIIGEEIGTYQGAYKVTKGLFEKFGKERIWDTPISEIGFTGISVGAAMHGLKPIVEFMTWNFAMQAIDQIINGAAKLKYMSNGDLSTQIVFRGLNGPASAVAAQHSQDFSAWFSQIPGLIVISPYDAEDCKGLLKVKKDYFYLIFFQKKKKAAIRDPNPVVFLENEIMYGKNFEVSQQVLSEDFVLPIGKAKIMRQGTDVTIVSYSKPVGLCLDAAKILEKDGISAEVINLRTLRPLDRKSIVDSVKKTHRIVSVEEGWPQSGIGSEIAGLLFESSAFNYLDAPLERITGLDIPMPYAPNLEAMSLPNVQNIINAVKRTMRGVK